jgi:flagellar basal-body rod modification protein FlgD
MAVSGVSSTSSTSSSSSTSSAQQKATLNYDNFLQLLIAQMKNQDPTDPMDASEQVSQLATFSQVEQSIQTNKNLESLISSSALSQAGSIIGRTLTSPDGSVTGLVKQVRVNSDGITALLDTGDEVDVTPGVTIQ